MYGVVKRVIESKKFELSDMLNKIDTLWVQGNLDDNSRAELISLARGNALAGNSVDVLAKLEEIDRRLKAVEDAISTKDSTEEGDTGVDVEEGEGVPVEITYPEYKEGTWYYAGDIVIFEGKAYKCVAPDGAVCVWSPSGYPAFWAEHTEESEGIAEDEGEPLT